MKILLIEDDPDHALLETKKLGNQAEVVHCELLAEALYRLEAGEKFNLILLDPHLPDIHRIEDAIAVLCRYALVTCLSSSGDDSPIAKQIRKTGTKFVPKSELLASSDPYALLAYVERRHENETASSRKFTDVEIKLASLQTAIAGFRHLDREVPPKLAVLENDLRDTINGLNMVEGRLNRRIDDLAAVVAKNHDHLLTSLENRNNQKQAFTIEKFKAWQAIILLLLGGVVTYFFPKAADFLLPTKTATQQQQTR
jgi:CheY-like chemotaxis protein